MRKTAAQKPKNIHAQFAQAETAALLRWRELLYQHVDGAAVDLQEVATLAGILGVRDAATGFSHDVETLFQIRDVERRLEEERAALKAASDNALEADAKVWRLRSEVAEAERVLALPPILAHGVSVLHQKIGSLQRGCPRLFVEATAKADAVDGIEPTMEAAWLNYRKRPTEESLETATFFEDDDGND